MRPLFSVTKISPFGAKLTEVGFVRPVIAAVSVKPAGTLASACGDSPPRSATNTPRASTPRHVARRTGGDMRNHTTCITDPPRAAASARTLAPKQERTLHQSAGGRRRRQESVE